MKKEIKLDVGGFTLLELMIVLTIAAILVSMAVPSFQRAIQNNRAYTQVNKLHTALMYARSEAIKTGKTVSVCPPKADDSTCSGNTDWSGGWAVFDAANKILRRWEALSGTPTLTGSSTAVTFSSTGEANASCFKLVFPDVKQYKVEVAVTGRSIVTNYATVSCP